MIATLLLLAQVAATDPVVVQRARPDGQAISFRAAVVPETVTVGQQAVYQVAVFVPDEVRQRLRRNPEYVPPELRAMLAYELPRGGYRLIQNRTIGTTAYEIHVFQRALFPITAGTHVISPAELTYALPLGSSFFSREEPHTLRSEPVTIVARDPPIAGRPADWRGAVGRFAITTRVETRTPRARDIVIVTARVEGEGNINLLPRPELDVAWGNVAVSSERVTLDTSAARVSGAKEFDWLVTPKDSGTVVIAPLRYVMYDPVSGQYGQVESAPETLSVQPGAPPGGANAIVGRLLPPVRSRWRGERAPWLLPRAAFLAAVAIVPLPALLLWTLAARRRRGWPRDGRAIVIDETQSLDERRRAFRESIERRLGLEPTAFASAVDVAGVLRRHGVTASTAAHVARQLAALDRAAFGGTVEAAASSGALRSLFDDIDREAVPRTRGERLTPAVLLVGLAIGAATVLRALAPTAAEQAFTEGVEAWKAQHLEPALAAFGTSARLAPRASDAWANLGDAAWASRDTALAAVAWQRALRLEPGARDMRDRLGLLGVAPDGWIAWVPPVDADRAAGVLATCWALGWGLLAFGLARPAHARRGVASVLLLASGFAAVVSVEGTRRAIAHGLVVVRGGDPLRALPALGAEASAQLAGGEVARVIEGGEVWSRVALDADRSGWIATERLHPLSAE